MRYEIEAIEGVGRVYGGKLRACGVDDTAALLEKAATPNGRRLLGAETGISKRRILEFANRADLMHIDGVGEEFSDLLELAGVDTVPELAQRDAHNLLAAIKEARERGNITRRAPSLSEVRAWIKEAKTSRRVLQY